jgi:hypothetical protein
MADVETAARELCLSFPEAEAFTSHGAPNFRVRKRTFATWAANVHGDGRVALWLNLPDGAQEQLVRDAPKHFFVPPYVGPRGWVGVRLDQGLAWKRFAELVREAWANTAPPPLAAKLGRTPQVAAPTKALKAEQLDPLEAPKSKRLLEKFRALCLALPETREVRQFGSPVWQAGTKTFAMAYDYGNGPQLGFWVGVDQQGLYASDPRYSIPAYIGHRGWIALAPGAKPDWREIESLARASYRHFALKRMLAQLGP